MDPRIRIRIHTNNVMDLQYWLERLRKHVKVKTFFARRQHFAESSWHYQIEPDRWAKIAKNLWEVTKISQRGQHFAKKYQNFCTALRNVCSHCLLRGKCCNSRGPIRPDNNERRLVPWNDGKGLDKYIKPHILYRTDVHLLSTVILGNTVLVV